MIVLDRIEALDFASLVSAGDAIVCGQGICEPVALTSRLVQQRAAIGRFELFLGPTYSSTFAPEHADVIAFSSWCGTGRNASLHAAGALDIVPAQYSDLCGLFGSGALRSDVVLLTASAPDANGRLNLGLCNDYVVDAARRARVVIAELSERVPWVPGAELPADVRVDFAVRTNREPLTLPAASQSTAGGAEQRIADWVSTLVPEGATLEVGVGALPDLMLKALRGHRDLGVHSGVIGDGILDLIEAGAVTNARKRSDQGVSVAGLLMGSRCLFDFAHRNPAIRLAPPSETHALAALAAIPSFVAINGAIEIDITGQVNAEVANGRYIGAVGGQPDFVRGANASAGGRNILALPATGRDAAVSRIVTRLANGVVTTPRSDVDAVVTEFGIAQLRGKSLGERAKALIAIAHPDFREHLERAAHESGLTRG